MSGIKKLGYTVTAKGYKRITAGSYRNEYEHRVIMFKATVEFSFYGPGIPPGFTVEHVDHNRQHNCLQNLLLLESSIHNACSWWSWTR